MIKKHVVFLLIPNIFGFDNLKHVVDHLQYFFDRIDILYFMKRNSVSFVILCNLLMAIR